MDRQRFQVSMPPLLKEVELKFSGKNESYGQDDDAFYNFHIASLLLYKNGNIDGQFLILMSYVLKHIIALCNSGINDKEFAERWMDILVYGCLAISMKKEWDFELMEGTK